jgi:3',5'-cyclic AMP phosphodiesterase CpdA
MTAFRWLHFTDLHFGMSGQLSLWPNVEQVLLDDLDYLREQVGPWDLVIFTGDLTQGGTKAEFDALDTLLHKIWSRFADWEMTPSSWRFRAITISSGPTTQQIRP